MAIFLFYQTVHACDCVCYTGNDINTKLHNFTGCSDCRLSCTWRFYFRLIYAYIVFYSRVHLTRGRHVDVRWLVPLHTLLSLIDPGVEQVRVFVLVSHERPLLHEHWDHPVQPFHWPSTTYKHIRVKNMNVNLYL